MTDKRLWDAFSRFIRIRDAAPFTGLAECFTCGRTKIWKEMDCGHGIPRQHLATKFNETNNHIQCKPCNGFEEGMKDIYSKKVDKLYGAGTWDKLLIASRQTVHRGKFDIEVMTKYYKEEAKKIAKEKNLTI